MKFVKQILVGGLLLTALGQSSYAGESLVEEKDAANTKRQVMQPVSDTFVAFEKKVFSFLESSSMLNFFSRYMPSPESVANRIPASLQSPVGTVLILGTKFVGQANDYAITMASFLNPVSQVEVDQK